MIKINAHIPEKADGTSWYRGAGPLLALAHANRDLQITFYAHGDAVDWPELADTDVAILQRPFSAKCAEFFGICDLFRAKCIMDWDDNFGSIHPSNPTAFLYKDQNIKNIVKGLRQKMDACWTTTQHLADSIDQDAGGKKTVVVPNAWPDMWFDFAEPGDNNLICWRGGSSHTGDLLEFAPAMGRVCGKFPLWEWLAMGDPGWPILEHIPETKLRHQQWAHAPLYFKNLLARQPAIVIAPLQDTAFNRSKSNIAWMEAVAAGAVCVCPDWPEWRKPGTFRYQSREDFAETMQKAISTPRKKRAEMAREGQQYITENLLLSKVNELRLDTITKLIA